MKDLLKLLGMMTAAAVLFATFNPITALVWLLVSTVETFGVVGTALIVAGLTTALTRWPAQPAR